MSRASAPPPRSVEYPGFVTLFIAWTVLGVLAYARYSLLTGDLKRGVLPEVLGWLSCYYPWLFFTPLIFRLERRFSRAKGKWPKHIAILAMAGLVLSYLAYELTTFLYGGVQYAFHWPVSIPHRWWSIPTREFALEQALYWFAIGATYMIRNVIELREKERLATQLALEKSQLESSLRQAELETLRMRLNPHFLFNCLQNIAALSQRDSKTAGQMLTRLGDLLRTALKDDSEPEWTLDAELKLTQAYISIEKMRFGDRLSVLLDIAAGTEHALAPSFLLQPLVENAIKHGLRGEQKKGLIWIKSSCHDGELVLSVSDNGTGISQEELAELEIGVGLGSTCERLKRMYAEHQAFSIRRLQEGGTEVRISLPLRFKASISEAPVHEQPPYINRR